MNLQYIKKIISNLENITYEEKSLSAMVSSLSLNNNATILDVGCGYGKNIKLLTDQGYNVIGVEVNEEIVNFNKNNNVSCISVDEFDRSNEFYDVILMSHVIEHFLPDDLLQFIDHYLNRLKPNGYLIIITPLFSYHFYDDFDHIKPFSPVGINMVMGGKYAQVKYYGQNKIELVDISFRRSPFKFINYRGYYLGGQYHIRLLNIFWVLLFKASFHWLGVCDGWYGVYRKI